MDRFPVLAASLLLAVGVAFTAKAETAPAEVAFSDGKVNESLTGEPGDPEKGREWFAARKLGNCLACHQNPDLEELPFHGEVGPPLAGVGDRWTVEELRAIVINPKEVFGDGTIMPSFYRDTGFNRTHEDFAGKTILEPQQVEDVIAYLLTLKE